MINKNGNRKYLLVIGLFSLVISILLGRIMIDLPLLDFLEGMFMGISFATNLGYLVLYSLERGTLSRLKKKIEVE